MERLELTEAGREELEARFLERVRRHRRDFILFVAGGCVLSAFIIAGLGVALYMAIIVFVCQSPLHLDNEALDELSAAFWWIYGGLFLLFGAFTYRRQLRPPPGYEEDVERIFTPEVDVWALVLCGSGGAIVLFLFLSFPALVFHFIHQVFRSRGTFSREDVELLAFHVIADLPEPITPESLREELSQRPEVVRRALILLHHLKFIRPMTRAGAIGLMRTIELQDFVEGQG